MQQLDWYLKKIVEINFTSPNNSDINDGAPCIYNQCRYKFILKTYVTTCFPNFFKHLLPFTSKHSNLILFTFKHKQLNYT